MRFQPAITNAVIAMLFSGAFRGEQSRFMRE